MNKHVVRASLAILALLVVAVVILLRLPVVSLVAWDEHDIQVTDLDRSTLVGGDISMEIGSMPIPQRINISWTWCPGWQPLSWCLQVEARGMQFEGELSLGASSLRIMDADIQMDSLVAAGIDPALASLNASIRIDDLLVADRFCPGRSIEALTATAQIHQITVLGAAMGGANMVVTTDQGLMEVLVTGDHVSGTLESRNSLDYAGNFVLSPPPEFAALLGQFVQPGPGGKYEWSPSGQWTCGLG